jgi:hypothetical protein
MRNIEGRSGNRYDTVPRIRRGALTLTVVLRTTLLYLSDDDDDDNDDYDCGRMTMLRTVRLQVKAPEYTKTTIHHTKTNTVEQNKKQTKSGGKASK